MKQTIRTQRGLTMIIALMVVAVLLFVAVVLLSNAFGSVSTENSIRAKIAAFDAAEAGINRAVEALDRQHGGRAQCADSADQDTTGTMADGGYYRWCIDFYNMTGKAVTRADHANPKNSIVVPQGDAYAWSDGAGSDGERGVTVEAIIGRSTGLPLPAAAVDAGGDVYARGDVGIYESSPGANDATVRANGNIFETAAPFAVEGSTFAGGVDQLSGASGTHSGAPQMALPGTGQVDAAAGNASSAATGMSPNSVPPPTGSQTFFGDVFVDGDIDLQHGSVTFAGGNAVFIDGNLCIRGDARIINRGSVIWVTGTVGIASSAGGYSVAQGSSGMLVALGANGGSPCTAGGQYAVQFDEPVQQDTGFIYAPNGSIELEGAGVMTGAIVAGKDVYLDNTGGGGIKFAPSVIRPVPTYDFKVLSYMEY